MFSPNSHPLPPIAWIGSPLTVSAQAAGQIQLSGEQAISGPSGRGRAKRGLIVVVRRPGKWSARLTDVGPLLPGESAAQATVKAPDHPAQVSRSGS